MVSFFFNDTATTEIYTLSLHDALPISLGHELAQQSAAAGAKRRAHSKLAMPRFGACEHQVREIRARDQQHRSEEHTSELQSRQYLVCRLLLEKKKHTILSSIAYMKPTI